MVPNSVKLGNSSALAMPMRALWAAASISAPAMSGRRRNISAGTPTATWAGARGMARGPASSALDRARRLPQQGAQGVARLLLRRSAAGERSPGCSPAGSWPGRRPARTWRRSEAGLGDVQRLLLHPGVLLGLVDQHLERPDDDVGARHLGVQRHQRVVVVGDRCQQGGALRLDAAPVFAPEVQLPGGVEAQLEVAEVADAHGRWPAAGRGRRSR